MAPLPPDSLGLATQGTVQLLAAFERLWGGVVGVVAGAAASGALAPLGRACHFGLDNLTAEVAHFLLDPEHPLVDILEVHDAARGTFGSSRASADLLARLEHQHGHRVVTRGSARDGNAEPACDLVVFSEVAPGFSIERVLPRLVGDRAVVALVSHNCIVDSSQYEKPRCNYVNSIWEKSSLHRHGRCAGPVCMASVTAGTLQDPSVLPIDCEKFATANGSESSVGEFGQDWYIYWNFLRNRGDSEAHRGDASLSQRRFSSGGTFVDVGACLPFEYSNTVIFERCLGWKGVCVEPNPYLLTFLQAHRSCTIFQNCVDSTGARGKAFSDRDGVFMFSAHCRPLGEILARALPKEQRRIDVLSIDVEHGELEVLRGLPWEKYDVRIIVVEVTRGAQWLEVDTIILPQGYAKVAILGRDAVYVKLGELQNFAPDWWPLLARRPRRTLLPAAWAEMHQRVVDEELEEERRSERNARDKGLRRR
eukprot:TRINITY_DN12795_c1_g1_i1.p1 TRINITY_DN12795_c1_g1~~TRINITY_DN12795_c1_g1_i1.p1  ORF type:complete len:479 (+),score=74.57 TRINITY_DN12795_c1_g1_i1:114-1550(+)